LPSDTRKKGNSDPSGKQPAPNTRSRHLRGIHGKRPCILETFALRQGTVEPAAPAEAGAEADGPDGSGPAPAPCAPACPGAEAPPAAGFDTPRELPYTFSQRAGRGGAGTRIFPSLAGTSQATPSPRNHGRTQHR